jgi:hypothetical protein
MWIFLNDGFISVVKDKHNFGKLLVRARFKGDIERIFPTAEVREGEGTDYRFRASIHAELVASTIAVRLNVINYPNFKNSVLTTKDEYRQLRSDAYADVWEQMYKHQDMAKTLEADYDLDQRGNYIKKVVKDASN